MTNSANCCNHSHICDIEFSQRQGIRIRWDGKWTIRLKPNSSDIYILNVKGSNTGEQRHPSKALLKFTLISSQGHIRRTHAPPRQPSAEVLAARCRRKLYAQIWKSLPHNGNLYLTALGGTILAALVTGAVLLNGGTLFVSGFGTIATAVLVGGGAAAAILLIRHNETSGIVNSRFDGQFKIEWETALANHARLVAEHEAAQSQAERAWSAQEAARIAAYRQSCVDPNILKERIARLFENSPLVRVDFQTVADQDLTVVLEVRAQAEIINPKTKAISGKTGNIISKAKSRDEKEFEYATFVAGSALFAAVQVLNAAPFCNALNIAVFSDQDTRKAYHLDVQIGRGRIPTFTWDHVDPVRFLQNLGARIEGGKAKKNTKKPEWLDRLDRVRIDITPQ